MHEYSSKDRLETRETRITMYSTALVLSFVVEDAASNIRSPVVSEKWTKREFII